MRVDERERAAPRVLGRVRELRLLAVEEAVRRAVVDDDLVLDARVGQRRSKIALSSAVIPWSSPACSARIGHSIASTRSTALGPPRCLVGEP